MLKKISIFILILLIAQSIKAQDIVVIGQILSAEDSPVKIFLIATNEELMIARDTEALVSKL